MADGVEGSGLKMKITVKTPKDKKEVEVPTDCGVKEVIPFTNSMGNRH